MNIAKYKQNIPCVAIVSALLAGCNQAVPLTDMQAAYYGYSIVETRVWVGGLVFDAW